MGTPNQSVHDKHRFKDFRNYSGVMFSKSFSRQATREGIGWSGRQRRVFPKMTKMMAESSRDDG
jgi:hypothetical protein